MSRRRSIQHILLGGYGIAALLILVVGWFGYSRVQQANQELQKTILFQVEICRQSAQVESRSLAISNLAREYLLWQDPAEKTRLRTLLDVEARVIEELLRQLEAKVSNVEEQQALAQVKDLFGQYKGAVLALLNAHDTNGHEETYAQRVELAVQQGQLLDSLSRMQAVEQDVLRASREEVERGVALSLMLTAVLSGAVLLLLVGAAWYVNRSLLRPLQQLRQGTELLGQGQWEETIDVQTGDELEELASTFNQMAQRLQQSQQELRSWGERLEVQVAERTQALAEMVDRQKVLLETIRQMSTPVLPVHEGVLVMPLVGVIDAERADVVMESLLTALEQERTRIVILDITGVPVVDTSVAQTLLQAAQAVRLLGVEPVLVGITPAVAETVISLGLDLTGLVTKADLLKGVAYALSKVPAERR
ncbi:MAG: STAS domain-containing protein [Chloroflexia bacterium]|nr:STAS domain-containing protein [Chloroflexia bacterium]